jgi:hypothetical protein
VQTEGRLICMIFFSLPRGRGIFVAQNTTYILGQGLQEKGLQSIRLTASLLIKSNQIM